ncbi:MAG: WecB/TagA/CpsF family glycosyltransferase [Mesorhizobium sp.]|nr:WecB/TagA/CpsF family glycosyltransferase [Mesorhizobium sp.]MBL8576242.1 WecB/TagA/CpsF family glycosyltransferase [Mesorhizobium sp.]
MTLAELAPSREMSSHRHNMLGMMLDDIVPSDYLDDIIGLARDKRAGYCCVTNVHQCVLVHDDEEFRTLVNRATLVIPDSVILQRARSLRHGVPFSATMKGADIMLELCRRAATANVPIALIGGRDDSVLETLAANLTEQFPALRIAFSFSPPFRAPTHQEDEELVRYIAASDASLVFVGLGCPKQERWMASHVKRVGAMMIGVGAAFDFNAGIVRPSPAWVHRYGFEWLYRLASEPRRLWKRYLTTSPRFIWLLVKDAIRVEILGRKQVL